MVRRLAIPVVVVTLLLVCAAAPGQAQTGFSDSFHSTSLDNTAWGTGIGGHEGIGTITPQTDGLHMTLTSDNTATVFRQDVNSVCKVQGDFDAQVEYRVLTWPPANGIRLGLGAWPGYAPADLMVRQSDSLGAELYLTLMADGANATNTTDSTGRLRLTRTGDSLAGYFYSSGSWVLLHSHADPQYAAAATISLSMWGHDSTPGVEAVWENFSVTADALACPGPFTPTFSYTFDEAAPENPDILPADDDCPVGAPCKLLWWAEVPDGQPSPGGISGMIHPSSVVGFADASVIPNGAIVAKIFGSRRVGPVGRCATEGTIVPWGDPTVVDATADSSTTTGSPDDLCSFSHWPSQLNGVRDYFLATHPGSILSGRALVRWPGCSPGGPTNILNFDQSDGTGFYMVVGGDPTAPPSPPTTEECGPWVVKYVGLGVTADNPDTSEDEGGIPLRTCIAAGTHTITASLDRNDTPPGDPIVLEDTATCSPNTPAGSGVAVPLNGGTTVLGGIDLTFSNVTEGGSTTVITTTAGPPPPTGFKIVGLAEVPLYFDINTDASYSGDLTVCIKYDESQVAGPEANLKLMQRVDSGFVDVTTSVDAANDIICGSTTHLSIFVVAEPLLAPTPTPGGAPVGGMVNIRAEDYGAPAQTGADSPSHWRAALAGLAAAGVAGLAAAGLYVRRRWLR